jgi:hypothetical protein
MIFVARSLVFLQRAKEFSVMTHFSFLKALALGALLLVSIALWQWGVAGHEQSQPPSSTPIEHTSSSDKLLTPTLAPSANDSTLSAPYDASRINADSNYYQRVDASRLYQMAPIPAGQKRHEELQIVGEAYRFALPQSWLEQPLVVLAKPDRPVTFVALDSGKFANGDVSITIRADSRGLASTTFFVTNEGRYRVLAGSPENAGPAVFYVHCMSRTMRDDLRSGRYAEGYRAEERANKKRQAAAAAELVERIRQRRTIK